MAAADGWRYIAQRVDGSGGLGQFLDFHVPLTDTNIEDVLSGHNSLTGTISPEYARLKGPDGKPILTKLGTAIWAESPDGEIRGGGLLTHSSFDGPTWTLECTDLTGVTIDLPYTEANWWVNVDPLDVFRYIWEYVQNQPGSDLGITIDYVKSPIMIGTDLIQRREFDLEEDVSDPDSPDAPEPADPAPISQPANRYASNNDWRAAAVKAMAAVSWNADVVDDALKKWLNKDDAVEAGTWKGLTDKERKIKDKSIEKVGYPPEPPLGTYTGPVEGVYVGAPLGTAPDPTDPTAAGGDAGVIYQADPYRLAWYQDFDLSGNIDDLAANTPFDWHMIHFWEGEEIRHHIRLGYPRIGRRREDLRFVIGENIHTIPSIEQDGTEYANEVLVLGAGEGSSMVMGRSYRNVDGRVRKVAVVSDPSIRTNWEARQRANLELAKRVQLDDITTIQLQDHPHAPLGSIDLGDEILVEGDTGWVELEVWCRVIARSFSPDSGETQTLTLLRTDKIA